MAGNDNLNTSKKAKTDEFYTQLSTIEDELYYYRDYFKGKVVLCNADDPAIGEDGQDHFGDGQGAFASNFFRYFQLNFEFLGLKKLITTHYEKGTHSYKFEIVSNDKGAQIGLPDYIKTDLEGDGDFRSPECLALLDEADIVVTNPPFSLIKEYLPLLIEHKKKFVVMGNINHAIIKELFYYFRANKVWLGVHSGHFWFRVPDYYEEKGTDYKQDESGQKWRRMGNICWFTNLDIEIRHQSLEFYKKYTPEEYPRYDQYAAIDVKTVATIPEDYFDVMGVPITFLAKHNPEQFELLGVDRYIDDNPNFGKRFTINGKETYARILVKRIRE